MEIPLTYGSMLATGFTFIGVVMVCLYFFPVVTVVIPVLLFAGYKIIRYFLNTSREITRMESISKSPILSTFTEMLGGVKFIRCFGLQGYFLGLSAKQIHQNLKINFNSTAIECWLRIRLDIVSNLMFMLVIIILVLGKDNISPGVSGLCITYLMAIRFSIGYLVYFLGQLENKMVSVERADAFTKLAQEAPMR